MELTRRQFIFGSVSSIGLIANPAIAKLSKAHRTAEVKIDYTNSAFSILNRISFGATPAEKQRLIDMGLKKYLEWQLNPDDSKDAISNERITKAVLHIEYKAKEMKPGDKPEDNYPAVKEDRPLLALNAPIDTLWRLTDNKKINGNEQNRPAQEVRAATWIRAVYSEWQLREVMVEFWHNHFNVNAFGDPHIAAVFPIYDAIMRKNCFGNFRIFLEDIAQSTAMLFYLNNAKSKASPANENYARELFELHTLGADNYYNNLYNRWREVPGAVKGHPIGYIDQDVYEAARSFTGWTIEDGSNTGKGTIFPSTGKFTYFDGWHDNYQKRVLGTEFDPNSPPMADGREVLDLLAAHHGTALNLCSKLCRRFVSDEPPAELVKKAAITWIKYANHPDQIKYVLKTILLSHEFVKEDDKVKRPFDYVTSFLRMTGADFMPNENLFNLVADTGYKQFAWPTPTGHPDIAQYWLNTNSTLGSWNIIAALIGGEIKGVNFDIAVQTPKDIRSSGEIITYWVKRLINKDPDENLLYALMQYMPNPIDRNFVPDMTNKDVNASVQQMVMVVAMLPDFQVR